MKAGVTVTDADADRDEALFLSLYPAIARIARAAAPSGVDADDLIQDALANVLSRGRLSDLDDAGKYLSRAVINLAKNARRASAYSARLAERSAPPVGVGDPDPFQLEILDVLAPLDRTVVYLSVVEGLSLREIAEQLGLSHANARQRYSRAIKRLRRSITERTRGNRT
jgi:DNA-directed RNA polymerase specialized sigma24 family protein